MKPHNQHQLKEAIISFLKENPGRHFVSDVHFEISDYFADHCYKQEIARTLWELNDDGIVRYQGGFFIPPTNDMTTMTNEDQPMIQQHPITPPPELAKQWRDSAAAKTVKYKDAGVEMCRLLAEQAARWGADQELEACVQIMFDRGLPDSAKALLRVRRPKPPSLKEQALEGLDKVGSFTLGECEGCGHYSE